MELINKIVRLSVIILIPLAIISAFIEWKKLPAGILIGGLLGLANLKVLSWGIGGMLGTYKVRMKMIIFSIFRLLLLFSIIALFLYMKLVNIFGILIGFTVVFVTIIIESLKYTRTLPDE